MGRGLTKKQRRDAAIAEGTTPGLPDMSRLKRENAIPADPKALVIDPTAEKVAAAHREASRRATTPVVHPTPGYKPVGTIYDRPGDRTSTAIPTVPVNPNNRASDSALRWKTKTIREAVAEADAKGQAERDAKFRASRQVMSEQKGGGDFESKHPRVPRGEGDKSGEFTNK